MAKIDGEGGHEGQKKLAWRAFLNACQNHGQQILYRISSDGIVETIELSEQRTNCLRSSAGQVASVGAKR